MAQPTSRPTSEIGATAELAVANALTKAGYAVFLPFFNAPSRIDLIFEDPLRGLRRVQCKFGRFTTDAVTFYTCSHTGGVERGYAGEVDEFGVYCKGRGLVYLVPIENVPRRFACLRLGPTKNNQQRGVRWAEPYVLGPPW